MKKNMLKSWITFCLILFAVISTSAQFGPSVTINGPTAVETGSTVTYTITQSNINVTSASWNLTGIGTGNILVDDTNSATIHWTGQGTVKLDYTVTSSDPAVIGTVRTILNINVTGGLPPPAPPTPNVENIGCTSADLVADGVPPDNIQWYWQGLSNNGMSTDFPAYQNYPVTQSNTYYIRARNINTNLWSNGSTAISVTLATPTWYADSDGDGLGEPGTGTPSCSQPAGYVSNDLDQCAGQHGQGSETGCPVPISLSNENYVYSITPRVSVTDVNQLSTDQDALRNVTYFDGRGRKMQSVAIRQSINNKDIVAVHEYDPAGREAKTYLPYESADNNGSIKVDPKDAILQHYQNYYPEDFIGSYPSEMNPYAEVAFEENALSRPVLQAAPGHDWKMENGHEVKMEYALNTSYDGVKLFDVTLDANFTPTLSLGIQGQTTYADGKLFKAIIKDENWTVSDGLNRTTEEFKNMQGQVVLKRTYASVGLGQPEAHDTYYVYDDFGNLSFVLPPKVDVSDGVSASELAELCYQYKYDHRNRLIEKKIPSKEWEYIVYDKLDRPVLTQDALQRQSNKWLYTKYDKLGRIAYTGEYTNTSITGQSAMQSEFDNQNNLAFELYENKLVGQSNLNINYENDNFPNNNVEVLIVNYYDSYTELPSGFVPPTSSIYDDQTFTSNTQGLSTVTKVKVLDSSTGLGPAYWITSLSYYDEKNRPIYIYSKNDYLQTTDIIESHLDFVGKVLETTTTHKKQGENDIIIMDRFEYDSQDRLLGQTQKIGNQVPERIVKNNYDVLGQLSSKLTGSGTEKGYTDITTNISITNDIISKTSGSCWFEGVATKGSFDEDGYVEYEVGTTTFFMVGLSDSNPNPVWTTIDYAIFNENSNIVIYENASHKGYHEVSAVGDVFRIERVGNKIYYKKNGEIFYTSQTLSTGTLLGDVSICANGTQIKDLHIVDNSKGLQNVDYNYNVRGWMTDINNVDKVNSDLFTFKINYNKDILGTGSGTSLYNGNIAQIMWKTANTTTEKRGYSFDYDALNRLTNADSRKGNTLSSIDRFSMWANYDKNGNITRLNRNGHITGQPDVDNNAHYGTMDDLHYTYNSNSNQLRKVLDNGNDTYGFKDGANLPSTPEYTYDVNGNMTFDANKGISNISYNYLNLPTQVQFASQQASIEYVYDAAGMKLKKKVSGAGISATETHYAGNFVYEKVNSNPAVLQFFNHPEGYVNNNNGTFEYVYQYKDHLGNVRLSYSDANGDGVISDVFFADDLETANGWDSAGSMHGYTAEYDTSTVHTGDYSGKIVNPVSTERFVHSNQWIPINNAQATSYTFSGWLYSNGPSAQIFLFMNEENEAGYFTQVEQVSTSTTNQWVYVEKTVSVPANIRHLNIRVDNNGMGTVWFDDIRIKKGASEIIEEFNNYPYGLKQKGYNAAISSNGNAVAQKFKYNGIELEESLGLNLYEMDVRTYDPAIARFNGIDPVTHHSQGTSVAFDNNPVFWADPSGADATYFKGEAARSWFSNMVESMGGPLVSDEQGGDPCEENPNSLKCKQAKRDSANASLSTWIIAKIKSAFGMADNEINQLREQGNHEAADSIEKRNNKTKEDAKKTVGGIYTTMTAFDPFGAANSTRFMVASDSDLSFEEYYNMMNAGLGTDYSATSNGIFGFLGLLSLGSGNTGSAANLWSNGRVFYSGAGSKKLAIEFANSNGFKLVTDMWYGRVANYISVATKGRFDQQVWSAASFMYAITARGNVHTFLTPPLRNGNIWTNVEHPALRLIDAGVIFK